MEGGQSISQLFIGNWLASVQLLDCRMCAGSNAADVLDTLPLRRFQLSPLSVRQQEKLTVDACDNEQLSFVMAG